MSERIWNIADSPTEDFVSTHATFPPLIRQILWRRSLKSPEDVEAFLQPDYAALADPFLFRHMRSVVDRIIRAIRQQEPIMIYGDYDADGVTATAVVFETLQALGAVVRWYLPERLTEGYGLNVKAIAGFVSEGTKLLITVDCGTSNVEEIQAAKKLGCDVVVFDHHHRPEVVPAADAIINPVFPEETYPCRGLSSAGVAFTVARALLVATKSGATLGQPLAPGWEKWLLDLVAISTVADMMPLVGENRTLVRYGLLVLRKSRRPGIRALFAIVGSQIERADEYTIGFTVAPRLNAAGRLHHASIALELLLTNDVNRAQQLAEQLQGINQDRQQLTEMAVTEAIEQVQQQLPAAAVTAFAPHWSPGILGLVAGRIADRLWRPVVVMAENDGQIVGSGRSVPGVDIMSVMDEGREFFLRFGGHPGACGFTLRSPGHRVPFEQWFRKRMASAWEPNRAVKTMEIDGRARLQDFSADTLDLLETLGPYGVEHPRPLFALEGVRIIDVGTVGNEAQHLRLTVHDGTHTSRCIGFRHGARISELQPGQHIDVAVEASWNVWQGRREPQLRIIDLRSSL